MSGVVLRCPTCGTTQSHPGECDACFAGDVRYFCGNHSPGLWLDEPMCTGCGANFGDAPVERPAPTPRAAPTVPARKTRRPASLPPIPRGPEPPDTGFRRTPARAEVPEEIRATPSLADVLVDMLEKGKRRRRKAEEVPPWEPTADVPRKGFPIVGCLVRLVLVGLLLILLALFGLFLLMGGAFRGLIVEFGPSPGRMSGAPEHTTCRTEAFQKGDLASAEQERSLWSMG